VHTEIELFGHGLSEKREIIVLSKTDLVLPEESEAKRQALAKETGREVLSVSIEDPEELKRFSDRLTAVFAEEG
jgi:GTPase involved in cell partitioning and DNA repair